MKTVVPGEVPNAKAAGVRNTLCTAMAALLVLCESAPQIQGAGKPGGGGGGVPGNPAIAYVAEEVQLKVMDADGANQRLLYAFTDAFFVGTSLRSALFLANEDGTGRVQLPLGNGSVGRPTWSPDGRHLVYSWSSETGDRTGDGLRLLTFGEDGVGNIWVESDVLLLSERNLDGLGFREVTAPSFSKTQNKITVVPQVCS